MKRIKFISLLVLLMQVSFATNGQDSDSPEILDLKIRLFNTMEDTARISILNELANSYYNIDEFHNCMKYASKARILTAELIQFEKVKSNPLYHQKCMELMATATMLTGVALQFEYASDAIDTLKSALEIMSKTGGKNGMGEIHQSMGMMYENLGQHDLAMEQFQLAKSIYKETGNKKELGYTMSLIGISQRYKNNYGDAIESLIEALEIGEELNDTLTITETLMALGFTFLKVEKWEEALDYQKQALELFTIMNDSTGIARVYSDLGVTYMSMDNLDTAVENHQASLAIRININDAYYAIASSYFYLGTIYLDQNKYQKSLDSFVEALRYSREAGISVYIIDSQREIGNVYRKMGKDELALKYYHKSLDVSKEKKDWLGTFDAYEAIADVYFENGKAKPAIKLYNMAISEAPENEYFRVNIVYKKLADAYVLKGNYKKGFENYQLYSQTKDSVLSRENSEKITILTSGLDYEKKKALQNENHEKLIQMKQAEINQQKLVKNFSLFGFAVILVMIVVLFVRFTEKNKMNTRLNNTLSSLKATQSQLIQSEKMASLGELTAGIAHEIQNPLNFVNNFSEVSHELIDEMNEEIEKGEYDEAKIIAEDVKQNLEKITHHGKRAEAIVKGMLQHSRSSSGAKEPTDINALADEYLRLAYHGLRAKNKSFNATMKSDFDNKIGSINIIPQDIGRVILNLITNAFYAVNEKQKSGIEGYEPTVSVSTKKEGAKVVISVKDNGNGIPKNMLDKIFQPFFTTKPTGQGTGLGLSMSYDIITKGHGGELKVETREGIGSEFIIKIPIV